MAYQFTVDLGGEPSALADLLEALREVLLEPGIEVAWTPYRAETREWVESRGCAPLAVDPNAIACLPSRNA